MSETIQHVFANARKYNLYAIHLVYLYMINATKMLVVMFVMYYLVFNPLMGRTEF